MFCEFFDAIFVVASQVAESYRRDLLRKLAVLVRFLLRLSANDFRFQSLKPV